jgi:tetratricopeptide (TPR) repeat protein
MVYVKNSSRSNILLCLFLAVVIALVFGRVATHDFVNLDDGLYVYENHHLREGFSIENIKWAFSTFHAGNWHPLTWLSHIIDYEIYGLDPMGHHWTSVQLHIANTLLLFFTLQMLTGTFWRSAFVAALFALHPIHVESVAWVSSRKDVLSTFLGFLTIAVYYRYVMQPRFLSYLLVFLILSLGLLAKPMLVTFPFVLLLLDFWPLKRFHLTRNTFQAGATPGLGRYQPFQLFLEKIPLLIPVVISSILTFMAQQRVGSLLPLGSITMHDRIENALVAYVKYIFKAIWPHHLAAYYPYPDSSAVWKLFGAALLIALALLWAVRVSKRFPYVIVGLLWYFGTLVPVIGLLQVGGQAMADRYTYIPLTGIFIIVAWGAFDLFEKWRYKKMLLAVSGAIILTSLTASTYLQVGHWKNSLALYQNAINVTDNNYFAYNGLGAFLHKEGDFDAAIYHYKKALSINPDYADAHSNLGLALFEKGKIDEAVFEYKEALKIRPDHIAALYNLAIAHAEMGKLDEAVFYYQEALKLKPDYWKALFNLANTEVHRGDFNAAAVHYGEALRINPKNTRIHHNYGNLFFRQGKYKEAMFHFTEAIKIDPDLAKPYDRIGLILAYQGKFKKARLFFLKAIQIKPNYKEARKHLEKYKIENHS